MSALRPAGGTMMIRRLAGRRGATVSSVSLFVTVRWMAANSFVNAALGIGRVSPSFHVSKVEATWLAGACGHCDGAGMVPPCARRSSAMALSQCAAPAIEGWVLRCSHTGEPIEFHTGLATSMVHQPSLRRSAFQPSAPSARGRSP